MDWRDAYLLCMPDNFTDLLLQWYSQRHRPLPWRGVTDAYAIWISEIMLQQTRVETVIPYFERWMKRFPTITTLADASQQEVLACWEGLGYYSRARNLHLAAQKIVAEYGGSLPTEVKGLRKLPGIGSYTAAAIASIAFGLDEPALDGNISRVLSRLFNLEIPADSNEGKKRLLELAARNLPAGKAGDYNQAMMDLGATICKPRLPDCEACPLDKVCVARLLGVQEQRPVTSPRPVLPHYTVTAAIIPRENKVLIARRPPHGLLGGLWEFPGGKQHPGEDLPTCLRREIVEELGVEIEVGDLLGVYRHAFTHFHITLHAFCCTLVKGEPRPIEASEVQWVERAELANYPMGKVDRQIASRLVAAQ